jgi:hypothetical protein
MPYNSETGQYERRVTTILDETPDGDTVNSAVAVKIDAAVDDGPTDLNHHKVQGGHYPATSTATGSRYLHQSPAGVVSWRDGVPADQAAQADASNVTDGAAWRAAIGAEVAGAAVTEVATHNADASAHGLDSTVWTVAQGGTGVSTAEDARTALDVYSKGEVDAALGGIRTGTAHAPQSIIKAALGLRPDGWTAADCDAPVASLSYSGNVVTVEAGLQVAYADNGRVQLSEELSSPQTVDLSSAADGTHHVYADITEDGTFSGFGYTDVAPEVGVGRVGAGDIYNPATVTMYDKDDNPIRRVYLGWVEKVAGVITDVHCYSLGDTTIVPVNNGANVSINSRYIQGFPYVAGGAPTLTSQIYFQGKWGETGFIFSTDGFGTKATTIGEDLFFQTGSYSLTSLGTNSGSDFTMTTNTPTKGRIKVRRGY